MDIIFEDNNLNSPSSLLQQRDGSTNSPIKDYLKDKTIFLTGGFGFIGKLMVEKLLQCEVKRIYLFVRAKKGKSIEERFETLTSEPIFTKLLEKQEKPFTKLTLVEGDLQKVGLGISFNDRETLVNDVEIVYHAAADVRFDENLKDGIETNVRGTREIMLLSQQMLKLNVFIYVSTAFCTPSFNVRETFYKTNLDPDFIIELVENLKPDDYENFESIARRIIQPYPNTYTYSKALSELVVRKYGSDFHTAIIRPSIVTTVYKDPLPGYTDNLYGVNGVVTGAGVGVLRILHINNKLKANIVPADFVVNATVGLAWHTAMENNFKSLKTRDASNISDEDFYHDFSNESIKIYHCTVSNNNPVTWADVKELTTVIGNKNPIKKALYIIRYNTTKYYYVSQFLKFFYHFLPALLIDTFLEYRKKKPKLMKIYRKVNKFSEVLSFFTINEWNFENENMKRFCNALSQHDKKFFLCDIDQIQWRSFFVVFCAGLRKYLCHEDTDTLEEARKRNRRLFIFHYTLMAIVYSSLAFIAHQILKFYGLFDIGSSILSQTNATYVKHID